MAVKKVIFTCAAVIALSLILTITSMSFANSAVELGFLTGVGGRKLFAIPFSGGVGIGVVNLIPIAGFLLVIGSAVWAAAGLPWANSSDETELKL